MRLSRIATAVSVGMGLVLFTIWLLGISPVRVDAKTFLAPSESDAFTESRIPDFYTSTFVISDSTGLHHSLTVDSNGRLHVSFNNAAENGLYYAVYDGTAWSIQSVDSGGQILRNSIAIASNSGTPYISYEKNRDLKYAYLNGGAWQVATVVSGTQTHRHKQNAIAVDSNGSPHLAFSTDWQVNGGFWFGSVEYARLNGTAWQFSTVYTHGEEVRSPLSLALNNQDHPQILYKKKFFGGDFKVHLQRWDGLAWQLTELESGWYNSYPPGAALTVDGSDQNYWTYMWHGQVVTDGTRTILTAEEDIGYSDIAIDDAKRLYVIFQSNTTLRLAVKSACGWTQMPLISISEKNSDVSIVVSQNIVHVVYFDGTIQSLRHLTVPVASIIGHLEPLHAQPTAMVADAKSTTTITATVKDCANQPLSNTTISFGLDPALDTAFIHPQKGTIVHGQTNPGGVFSATLKAGVMAGTITVKGMVDNLPSLTAKITLLSLPDFQFTPNYLRNSRPGEVLTFTHTLTNYGPDPDVFQFSHHSNDDWPVTYNTVLTVSHGQTIPVAVRVTVPNEVASKVSEIIIITATSKTDPAISVSVTDTIRIESELVYLPLIMKNYWAPKSGDAFFIGQRSGSLCAEHDSYVVPVAGIFEKDVMPIGTEITTRYRIKAVHPEKEEHPLSEEPNNWCNEDWANCPIGSSGDYLISSCKIPIRNLDTISKVFDNVQEQIYVLDGPPDIGTFEVVINNQSFGQHTGIIFGSRWGAADSWNHDGVIYANGFTRWKPKGEQPGAETDPCFGTSVVLGPFQLDKPFLSDGYSPNPLRHPNIDQIDISVGTGWSAQLSGTYLENGSQLADVFWTLDRLNINATEMQIAVAQRVQTIQDISLFRLLDRFGIGLVEFSSMFAEPQKHDADTQIGPGHEIWTGNIPNSNQGLWGQETPIHHFPEEGTLCLETKTPTTHNTGSPTICILLVSSEIK